MNMAYNHKSEYYRDHEMLNLEDRTREQLLRAHPFWPLITEINNLKRTLCEPVATDSPFAVSIEEHVKRIQDTIPLCPEFISCVIRISPYDTDPGSKIYCPYPLCQLLNNDKFCPREIPLSILELLVTAGFDVNDTSYKGETCLHSAIDSGHYNAVRWLVDHGAARNAMNHKNLRHKTPIVNLASGPNVPLDLFDLLKTPENLNDGTDKCLPLREALRNGCINSALYLISLGAEVNKIDGYYECLPIECYIAGRRPYLFKEQFEFHEELFIKLLPLSSMNTFEIICKITLKNFELVVASKMVYPLLQRHVNTGNISLSKQIQYKDDYQAFYLESLLVLLLDLDVTQMPDIAAMMRYFYAFMPEVSWKQRVVDIWEAYDQRHGKVKSLFKLCIQCTRKSMKSLDDDSFQSLPLPSKIQNVLMLRDIAEVICKAWKLWPKCVKVRDIVNNCQ